MSLLNQILYSFTAEEEGELSVKAGDLVVLKSELSQVSIFVQCLSCLLPSIRIVLTILYLSLP